MKETLYIKNFGPIVEATIEIKDINIFIGTTSSGKSTVAKLIAIFRSGQLHFLPGAGKSEGRVQGESDYRHFKRLLISYNIDFAIHIDTCIRYNLGESFYEIRFPAAIYDLLAYKGFANEISPIYIPAERIFFSTFSQSILSLLNNDIAIPKWLLDFGAKYEKARLDIRSMHIDFLNIKYFFEDGNDMIELPSGQKIQLSQASSGVQSLIPLMLVIQYNSELANYEGKKNLYVVEEGELSLYPGAQKELIEYIIGKVNNTPNKLVLTTHSPYLLTAIDNLIQAYNVTQANPDLEDEVSNLVFKHLWVNYDNVACYYFNNGTVKSTLENELQSIGPSNIDDVSEELSETFEKLIALRYDNK